MQVFGIIKEIIAGKPNRRTDGQIQTEGNSNNWMFQFDK